MDQTKKENRIGFSVYKKKKNRKKLNLIGCSFNPIIEQNTFIFAHETLCNVIRFYVQQNA